MFVEFDFSRDIVESLLPELIDELNQKVSSHLGKQPKAVKTRWGGAPYECGSVSSASAEADPLLNKAWARAAGGQDRPPQPAL